MFCIRAALDRAVEFIDWAIFGEDEDHLYVGRVHAAAEDAFRSLIMPGDVASLDREFARLRAWSLNPRIPQVMDDRPIFADAVQSLVIAYAKVNNPAKVEEAAQLARGWTLAHLQDGIVELAKEGHFDEAIGLLPAFPESDAEYYRNDTKKEIAIELARQGDFDRAEALIREIPVENEGYCAAITASAAEIAKRGAITRAYTFIGLLPPLMTSLGLNIMAIALIQDGQTEQGIEAARNSSTGKFCLNGLADQFAQDGNHDLATQLRDAASAL